MNHNSKLRRELTQAGATDIEVDELAGLAVSLKQLKNVTDTKLPGIKSYRQSKWRVCIPAGLTAIVGVMVGVVLVILSQTTLPGSLLYPIQKLSDSVAVSIDPNYRGIVMMKRAQEVKQLVADHASSGLVLATLNDYKNEAWMYKSAPANYAAFEYCKSSLQQAATLAPNPERHAIENTLSSLQDV